jgi:hypothetical protein
MKKYLLIGIACLLVISAGAEEVKPTSILERASGENKELSSFLIDTAAGSVSASGMLGISGDSINNVENVKGVVLALKSIGGGGSKEAFGISITPARTSLTPMSLASYAKKENPFNRLLGSLAIGYAQGNADVNGVSYQRRAVSLETNLFLNPEQDPLLAHWQELTSQKGDCALLPGEKPNLTKEELEKVKKDKNPAVAEPDKKVDPAAQQAREAKCREQAAKKAKWNASQISFAVASGRIKAADGKRDEYSLGSTAVLGVTLGFPWFDPKKVVTAADAGSASAPLPTETLHALSITLRRTVHEPVLSTLGNASPTFKDSSLAALRYTVGTHKLRGLLEASRSNVDQVTASQRTFKRAAGFDIQVAADTWINLRLGKQRKIDGNGEETGSLLSVSYSPSTILKP